MKKYLCNIIFLTVLCLFLFSCMNNRCETKQLLIQPNKDNDTLILGYFSDRLELEDFIKIHIEKHSLCNTKNCFSVKFNYFDDIYKNDFSTKYISMMFYKYCPYDLPIVLDGLYLKVIVDSTGFTCMTNKGNIDCVKIWAKKFYSNQLQNKQNGKIVIAWINELDSFKLDQLLSQIVNSYITTLDAYSIQLYNKNICDLSAYNLNALKDSFPISIAFAIKDEFEWEAPKPPPPVPDSLWTE